MSSFRRLRFLWQNWKQILGYDTSIRDQTIAVQHELQRLRVHREVVQAAREKEALEDLRKLVDHMKSLEQDLGAAEQSAVQFVDSLGEQAKQQLEADLNAEAEGMIDAAMRSAGNRTQDLDAASAASSIPVVTKPRRTGGSDGKS